MERSSDITREGSVPNGQAEDNIIECGKAGSSTQEIAPPLNEDLKDSRDQIEKVSKDTEATGTENLATQNLITQTSSGEPVMQISNNVGGNWKAVMHSETNQCYYWNTFTGETSWEVPADSVSIVPAEVAASDNVTCVEASREESEFVQLGSLPLECHMSCREDAGLPTECDVAATEEDKTVSDDTVFSGDLDPEKLVKYGKDLLERLKLLNGSSDQIEEIRKEIEIRTSDCKVLSSYGLSVLPFWLHTETQLKLLEASICNAEAYFSKPTPESGEEETEETFATLSSLKNSNQIPERGGEGKEKEKEEKEEEKEEIKVKTALPIDDVDMEVEEENFRTDLRNCNNGPPLPFLEEGEVPPPPSHPPDEWVPPPPPPPEDEVVPPPPDDEPVPPPPPLEEPSISYSVVETIPPSYQSYMAVPTYSSSASAVGYAQPHYYEAYYTVPAQVPVPVTSGVVEPTVYNYTVTAVQRASEIPTKLDSSLPMHHTKSHVGLTNEVSVFSTRQAVGSVYVAGDSLVPTSSAAASSVTASSAAILPVATASATATSAAATLAAASSAATSTVAASSAATSSASALTKNETKAGAKSKKRTIAVAPTLRLNKKVASLVHKWKAAKEELHADEDDEFESAYEALERKRQKEIEDWRLHQIASGEAQDNANFVPLGGDWRERVKKKRANKEAKMEDTPQAPSDAATMTTTTVVENGKQQGQERPDLVQLSIGLPSGWQAYWDESSKQVYYGNAITSETSWVRPT